jgi:hypothetical protein
MAEVASSPSGTGACAGARQKPHRATTVLVLGILGLAVCVICGIIAWVMGRRDLDEMDAKVMDPAGRDDTRAGMICGMIACILNLVLVVLLIALGLAGA